MEKLKRTLEKNREYYVKLLQGLVAIDTHTIGHGIDGGLEKEGQEYLIKLMEEMGADEIEVHPLTEEAIKKSLALYNEGNSGHVYDDRFNVYGTFRGSGGRSLMFNGHMDTMPAGDLSKWKYLPHDPVIEDNKIYGLGTADMKSGLLASLLAVHLLKDAGEELPGDVTICSVSDEEGGGNGSIAAAMHGVKADGVVVCEGTSDELVLAHMGFVFFEVKVQGKANHSGGKWLGVSAIDKAFKIIQELNEMEHRWLLSFKHNLLPAPNMNVGVIEGGTAGSTVPGECSFKTCVHYLPGTMSHEQVVREFTEAVERAAAGDIWLSVHRPEISVYQAGGAYEMEERNLFTDAFKSAYYGAKGRQVKVTGSPAGCDSRIWRNVMDCPTVQFGPGNLEQCHSANEYVEVDAYLEAIFIYAQLIKEWCRKEKED